MHPSGERTPSGAARQLDQDGAVSSTLRRTLSEALPAAMKERDRARVAALRGALSAVANAEAVDAAGVGLGGVGSATEVERRCLTEPEVEAIVREHRDELRSASAEMQRVGQPEQAEELADQAAVLDGFLDG